MELLLDFYDIKSFLAFAPDIYKVLRKVFGRFRADRIVDVAIRCAKLGKALLADAGYSEKIVLSSLILGKWKKVGKFLEDFFHQGISFAVFIIGVKRDDKEEVTIEVNSHRIKLKCKRWVILTGDRPERAVPRVFVNIKGGYFERDKIHVEPDDTKVLALVVYAPKLEKM